MLIRGTFTIKAANIYGNDTYIPRTHKHRRLTAKTEWLRPTTCTKSRRWTALNPSSLSSYTSTQAPTLMNSSTWPLVYYTSSQAPTLMNSSTWLFVYYASTQALTLFQVWTSLCLLILHKHSRHHSVSACKNMLLQKTDLIIQQRPFQTSKGRIKSLVFSTTLHLKEGALQVIRTAHNTRSLNCTAREAHISSCVSSMYIFGTIHIRTQASHLWLGVGHCIYTCDLDQTWIRG